MITRSPNRNKSLPLASDHGLPEITLEFTPDEFSRMEYNKPGKSEKMGGYQGTENLLISLTDRDTLRCRLESDQHNRVRSDCQRDDKGGPNGRIRSACIPAFRRLGIELLPQFSSSYVRKVPHDDPRLVVRREKSIAD